MRVLIRELRSDERGVASTVGTIMALLVFLTFLSLIVNQYVPVWMKDSEASHMNTALGNFGSLKGAIDLQVLAAQAARNAGAFYIPTTASAAIGLGVDGVPIFAAPTIGTLKSSPDSGPFTVQFSYLIRGVPTPVRDQSNGTIDLDVANRYYVPQRVAYENGAVIRYQGDGQVVRAQPTFAVIKTNNSLDISFGLVSLYGTGAIAGTSTEIVNTQVFAFDRQDYRGFASNAVVWINHTSRYALAWYTFLNQTLADALKLGGTYVSTPLDQTFTGMLGALPVYQITSRSNPSTGIYIMQLKLYNNALVMPLSVFRLLHAQVQIGVGDNTQSVQF